MSLKRPNRSIPRTLALVLSTLPAAIASAAPAEKPPETPRTWEGTVALSTAEGAFLPLTLLPSVGPAIAMGSVLGGYDTAREAPRVESYAEAKIFGPVALRLGASLRDEGPENELAPSVGARVQVLRRERAGFDGALALTYKAEGFSEPEGELEAVFAIGTRIGKILILGNLVYGQDFEGNERDGELRAATLYQAMPKLHLGLDARGRFDLGSNDDHLKAKNEPVYDLDAGPVLTATLGPVALNLHGGVSVIRHVDQQAALGAIVLGGLGTSF
jgi:hypothetical protein